MFCSICDEMPSRNRSCLKRSGSSSVGLPSRLRRTSQRASEPSATTPIAIRTPTNSPPSCQTRMPITTPPMPTADSSAPTTSTTRGPVYGHILDELEVDEDDRDHDRLQQEADAPRQERGQEAAEQRPDGGGDRGRGAHEGVGLLLLGTLEVAVDQRLHRRQQHRRAQPADDRPEHDDRRQALGERHRHGADRVAEQAEDERPLAPDQVADLAPDQDERRRHQRLERDRALHAADRRVEVLDDLRDRHVHQRCVDDEHEHRRREQHGQPPAARRPLRRVGAHAPIVRPDASTVLAQNG